MCGLTKECQHVGMKCYEELDETKIHSESLEKVHSLMTSQNTKEKSKNFK